MCCVREYVYWFGMNKELKVWICICEICCEYELIFCKEMFMFYEILDGVWEKIGVDFFIYNDKEYFVIVCYKFNFWELDLFIDIKLLIVIKRLKLYLV